MSTKDQTGGKPTNALFRHVLELSTASAIHDHAYWAAVRPLYHAPVDEVWALISPLARDPDPWRRALVPDVLRYLGGSEQPRREDTVRLLAEMLTSEHDSVVLNAIATAFVDLRHPAAIDLLRPLVTHSDATVRQSVVSGLLPVATMAVPELIRLSADEADDVRNWATFGLGSQLGAKGDPDLVDTREVREALAARLNDSHGETRAEAVLGLAVRGDERTIPVIIDEITRGTEWPHYIEAAVLLADTRLYEALVNAARAGKTPTDATKAIAACDPARSRHIE